MKVFFSLLINISFIFCIFFHIKMTIEVVLNQKRVGIFENAVNKTIKRKKLKEEIFLIL